MAVTFTPGTYWTVRLSTGAIARLCERVTETPYRVTHQGWVDSSDKPNQPDDADNGELFIVDQGWIVVHPDGLATQHRPIEVAGAYFGPLFALQSRNALGDEIVHLASYRPATFPGSLPGTAVGSLPQGARYEEVV